MKETRPGPCQRKTSQPPLPYSYDQIADIYDEDMGRNNPGLDIAFYVQSSRRCRLRILELGCGTGRITLPLLESGAQVIGIDRSLPMLRVLQRKARQLLSDKEQRRLDLSQAEMTRFALQRAFSLILCSFSSITYLIEPGSRARFFERIRKHLDGDGEFIFDLFVPDPSIDALPDGHTIHDYSRTLPDGTRLERFRRLRKAILPGINEIERYYRFLDASGNFVRAMTTRDRIRCYEPDEAVRMVRKNGFEVLEVLPDFQPGKIQRETRTLCIRCRPS